MKHDYNSYKNAIEKTNSMLEAASFLKIHFNTFKRHAIKFGLYQPNQGGKNSKKPWVKQNKIFSLEDIFNGLHPQYHTYKLKNRLLKENIFENKCSICGITEWNDKPLNCELDHIDGNRTNHKFENLRIICPNCHSQTDTYRAKNIKK